MMRARVTLGRNRDGFSLLEMLAVLGLLALMMRFAMAIVPSASDRVRLESEVDALVRAIKQTRAMAARLNREVLLTIDLERGAFSSPAVPKRQLGPDVRVLIKSAAGEQVRDTSSGIRVFADGSCTGAEIAFSLRALTSKMCVNWLACQIVVDREC